MPTDNSPANRPSINLEFFGSPVSPCLQGLSAAQLRHRLADLRALFQKRKGFNGGKWSIV
jgi:hypothetical protein